MIDELKLIETIKKHSQKFQLDEHSLNNKLKVLKEKKHNPWMVCCGHDLIALLSLGLYSALGSKKTIEVSLPILSRSLRLAYEVSYFWTTQLYASIQAWEGLNHPYQVFPT